MFGKKKEKNIEQVCGNCKLYDPSKGVCRIVVLNEGQKDNIPVEPQDRCFFDDIYFDPVSHEKANLLDQVKQVRFWVEGKDGKKTDGNGTVKVEYPDGFFGDLKVTDII